MAYGVASLIIMALAYVIYRKVDDFPKTGFLRDLFNRALELYGDVLGEFLRRHFMALVFLQQIFVASQIYTSTQRFPDTAHPQVV